ncbi:MAG TPA: RNA 3'-terminal phosphate cyclase [Phycisphaerae bacterium]|nr:RNA 3'-terminal phosphate cyclase [Phycisphaerae bacterium]HRY66905.1 RNA 3'-terminal phosphate cyclase [Phycisphaerae bacterium]HSA27853.1 RNA 3'-terminal phosphate cyclase [Phycisphaerae bacterium]
MLTVDGSAGEGGGQILRSSLALSMLTGTPFRIEKIRAGRSRPGLMRQHLTAVQAAAQVCGAEVNGATIASSQVIFRPGRVEPGEYTFSVGTAGSTTLVLQTVLPALLTASGPSKLTFEGGTHNPFAPPFDFLAKSFLPIVSRMGPRVSATLERFGFYPAGGGRFTVAVEPAARLNAIELLERGVIRSHRARALIANLPQTIAEREIDLLRRRTAWAASDYAIEALGEAQGPGNVVLIEVECEHVSEVFTGFGEVRHSAEAVATHALQAYQRYLKAEVPVGPYLADQVMLPLAIAGRGAFMTMPLTLHSITHVELIRQFLGIEMQVQNVDSDRWQVGVG